MALELSRSYLYGELIEYRELVEFSFFLSISPRVPDIQRNGNDVSIQTVFPNDSVTFLPLFPVLSFQRCWIPAVFGLRAG